MGLGGIRVEAAASVAGGRVTLHPTGQSFPLEGGFPLEGAPPPATGPAWRAFRVLDWQDPSRTRLEIAPAAPAPKPAG